MRKAIDREMTVGQPRRACGFDAYSRLSFERLDLKLTLSDGAYVRRLRNERSLTGIRTMTRRNISRGP